MQRYQREHFWNAIVWPMLWPLLLVQAALVVLCLVVGTMMWWMSPSYASWSTMLWLMAALLIGSSLNVGAFLMLVKAHARRKDARFMQELTELERQSQALCTTAARSLPEHQCSALDAANESHLPLQRLASVNGVLAGLERCMHCSQVASAATKNTQQEHEQTLLDDLQHQQRQLKYLMAGRERAREESRLKSSYLTLLQRETDSLLDHLTTMADKEITENCRQNVSEVYEHVSDIRALLANLVQQDSGHGSWHSSEYSSEYGSEYSPSHSPEYGAGYSALGDGAKVSDSERASPHRSLRVLVVDDGPVNLMLARQMLETQGLQVEGVSSGEQALERQQTASFDLVFMDIFMPTLDGLETTRRWREFERNRGGTQSVLVALTANIDNAGYDICLAAGMDDLLAKPYQPETLLNMIAHWFPGTVEAPPASQ
ncbi:response regulator [Vreelandella boliviensis]|uniref:Hybrid signal transduction histidine kinase L n=1 Tax=Vreelandella boliviensis LC1 TaxID=1072583 RepID=A0A265DUQ9_9GAMM|nr:response regulator [Halomonas boliviensis]EHJ91159.1 Hybrid signal transduction histidine kinase L [Halomonas boliviensis LC1]OZT73062.1 response regulator [Halomonas boliviensis LC1]